MLPSPVWGTTRGLRFAQHDGGRKPRLSVFAMAEDPDDALSECLAIGSSSTADVAVPLIAILVRTSASAALSPVPIFVIRRPAGGGGAVDAGPSFAKCTAKLNPRQPSTT